MKKSKPITITWDSFAIHGPGYDLEAAYGPFEGTLLDLMRKEELPRHIRLWAFTRPCMVDILTHVAWIDRHHNRPEIKKVLRRLQDHHEAAEWAEMAEAHKRHEALEIAYAIELLEEENQK